MIKTLRINNDAICSYIIKGGSLFVKMWDKHDTIKNQDKYIEIIRMIESNNRAYFISVQPLYISKPIF